MERTARNVLTLAIGAAVGVAGTLAFSGAPAAHVVAPSEPASAPPSAASPELAPAPAKFEACDPTPLRTLPPRPLSSETLPAFAAGTAVLRIGDGYVFGEDHARAADDKDGVDVVCADISGYLTLR